jgi:hypothetical protein
MEKRYFIELSRKDTALVSYCPGLEIKDDPDADWIEQVLVPALQPIARRKSAKIREIPITFWIGVRGTARCRAEIFLFVTPAYPGATIEPALSQALQPVRDGKVHAGKEPIPEEAFPCVQIFRGEFIIFYGAFDGNVWFSMPSIQWEDGAPELKFTPTWGLDALFEGTGQLPVEARILSVSNGEGCRKFQQALSTIAREID